MGSSSKSVFGLAIGLAIPEPCTSRDGSSTGDIFNSAVSGHGEYGWFAERFWFFFQTWNLEALSLIGRFLVYLFPFLLPLSNISSSGLLEHLCALLSFPPFLPIVSLSWLFLFRYFPLSTPFELLSVNVSLVESSSLLGLSVKPGLPLPIENAGTFLVLSPCCRILLVAHLGLPPPAVPVRSLPLARNNDVRVLRFLTTTCVSALVW